MKLDLVDSISLPGNPGKPNEDAFAYAGHMAVVFDGATGLGDNLMPGESDAAWLARFGARRLAAHASEDADPRVWIEHAAADAAKSFAALRRRAPKERWEIPVASLMVAALVHDGIEALWFGDCSLIVRHGDAEPRLLGDAFLHKSLERDRAAALARAQNLKPAAPVARAEFLPELRKKRNLVNTAKGGWLFAPDPRCARHAKSARVPLAPGGVLLLASDGFLALVSDYGRYDAGSLLEAGLTRGLAALGGELRRIEAEDAEGVRYPRFKRSDDATALLMRAVP